MNELNWNLTFIINNYKYESGKVRMSENNRVMNHSGKV